MMTAMMTAAIKCRLFIFLPLACLSAWPPRGGSPGHPRGHGFGRRVMCGEGRRARSPWPSAPPAFKGQGSCSCGRGVRGEGWAPPIPRELHFPSEGYSQSFRSPCASHPGQDFWRGKGLHLSWQKCIWGHSRICRSALLLICRPIREGAAPQVLQWELWATCTVRLGVHIRPGTGWPRGGFEGGPVGLVSPPWQQPYGQWRPGI